MNRREFITVVGGAATWPIAANAQPQQTRRMGIIMSYAPDDTAGKRELAALVDQLRSLGWTAGQNIKFDFRYAAGDANKMSVLAKEIVNLKPDIILARGTAIVAALLRETRTIPIVFVIVSDPVGDGLVSSLARPGGNVTGFTNVEASFGGKWVQLLKDINPRILRVGFVFNPETAPGKGSYYERMIESAAPSFSVTPIAIPVRTLSETEAGISKLGREPNSALIVLPEPFTLTNRIQIIESANRNRLPAIYGYRFIPSEGGLVSYGVDVIDVHRRAAVYLDRVLRGEKPNNLAVQAPVKFELVINLKAAKSIGVTIPPTMLGLADEVIE